MDLARPPRWKRFLKKAALGSLALLAVAGLAGFLLQRHRDAGFRASHPAPGSFATVDGHRMHYRLTGAGEVTFVLEAGLGDYSGSWGALESELGQLGRVFTYDRAGLGWSEPSDRPRTPVQIAAELRQLLAAARIPRPYLLVGHSLAGVSLVRFAMDFPDDVAGLLLIDPSSKDQFKRLPAPPALFTLVLPQLTRAAPWGLPQLLFGAADPVQTLASHVAASGAELRAFLAIDETWGDRPPQVGPIPLYVLTAGDGRALPGDSESQKKAAWETWRTMHAELVAGSTSPVRRQVVVEGATHFIHRTHLATVVDAARELVTRIKAQPGR